MTDSNNENRGWSGIITQILKGDVGEFLQMILFIVGLFSLPLILMVIVKTGMAYNKDPVGFINSLRSNPSSPCFKVEEVGGNLLKINTCTGEVDKLDLK